VFEGRNSIFKMMELTDSGRQAKLFKMNTVRVSRQISSYDMYEHISPLTGTTDFHIHSSVEVPKFILCCDRIWASICKNLLRSN
jgi:hypothetical protein